MMISIPNQIEQLKRIKDIIVDESAFEVALAALKSKKGRKEVYNRLMEMAGSNKASGADQLRWIAKNILNGEMIGV